MLEQVRQIIFIQNGEHWENPSKDRVLAESYLAGVYVLNEPTFTKIRYSYCDRRYREVALRACPGIFRGTLTEFQNLPHSGAAVRGFSNNFS